MQNQKTMAGSENEHTNSSSSSSSDDSDSDHADTPVKEVQKPMSKNQSSDDSDSGEEEEETQKTSQKQTLTPTSSSSSDDSDSDHADTPVKEVQKPNSKNQPALPAVVKRPAAEIDPGNVKKRAKRETVIGVAARDSDNAVGFGTKKDPKLLFARLWSEENEVELIQGLLNYKLNQPKKDPIAEINDFYEVVKGDVHLDVTSLQMLNKVKKLRKKYESNRVKFEISGKVRSFCKQHEKTMYDLSHNLWGTDVPKSSNKINVTSKDKKGKKSCLVNGYEVETNMVQLGSMGLMLTDEGIMSKGLKLLTGTKKCEMEEKGKALKVQELEHFVRKAEFLKEQAEVVLDAVKRSGAN